MAGIVGKDGAEEPAPAGVVPVEWVGQRCFGSGVLAGDYADVGHHESLAELRTALAARVVLHGLYDLDAATLRLSAPRSFTREVARYVFHQTAVGKRRWNEVSYLSKHGDGPRNWAIFEPTTPGAIDVADLRPDDKDLVAAHALHGLALE